MQRLIEWALKNNRAILLLFTFFILAGTITYVHIPKESTPDVAVPMVIVTVSLPGVSPQDGERLLVFPLEQQLQSIQGLKKIRSTTFDGGASVMVEFRTGVNIHKAIQDVREKVDKAKAEFPNDAKEPKIKEINLSLFPVLIVQLSGNTPERTLNQLGKILQDKIESIGSVLKADLRGDRDEVIEIILNPEKLETYGISSIEAINLFQQNHIMIPSGVLDNASGSFNIRAGGLLDTPEAIANIPIKTHNDIVISLKNIADVRKTYKTPTSIAHTRGSPAIAIEVSKRIGENIIDTIQKVETTVNTVIGNYKDKILLTYAQDMSQQIKNMLNELQNNIILAVILVMGVIVITLGLRSSMLVGISIPASFLMGIFILGLLHITLNIVVLFSLILSIGMLVDGAIIVVEYADRKMLEGMSSYDAYLEGAKRMAWPVITTTLTIIAVFLPLLYWPGIPGAFMKYLPITLIATLASSILVALLFIPVLGSFFGKAHQMDPRTMRSIIASETGDLNDLIGLTKGYVNLLQKLLKKPMIVLLGSLGILIMIVWLYGHFGKGVVFFPIIEPDRAVFVIRARGNLSLEEKNRLVCQVEEKILRVKEFKNIYTSINNDPSKSGGAGQAADTIGQISVEFTPWHERQKASAILTETLKDVNIFPGVFVEKQAEEGGGGSGKKIQILLIGDNYQALVTETDRIRKYMSTVEGLTDLDDSRPLPGIEWNVQIDRIKAATFGVAANQISGALQLITDGLKLGEYRPDDSRKEIDIRLRFPAKYRHLDQLDRLKIGNDHGQVPLGNFITRQPAHKISSIERVNGAKAMHINANTALGILPDTKVKEITAWLAKNPSTKGVQVMFEGEEEEKQETQAFLGKAFGIAIFLVAVILVIQFNSFFSTLLVLSAIILSTIGVLVGLMVTGQPFGIIMTGIGVIALSGIIVSNNIIFIDTFDRLVSRMSTEEAVLRTAAQRLRPIFLTKLTCILGLLPILLRLDIDFFHRTIHYGAPSSAWWVPLANAIVFGVLFASSITLFFTPCALIARDRYQKWRLRGKMG